jgi:hypothetical protein
MKKLLWKSLWTCCKADCGMVMLVEVMVVVVVVGMVITMMVSYH